MRAGSLVETLVGCGRRAGGLAGERAGRTQTDSWTGERRSRQTVVRTDRGEDRRAKEQADCCTDGQGRGQASEGAGRLSYGRTGERTGERRSRQTVVRTDGGAGRRANGRRVSKRRFGRLNSRIVRFKSITIDAPITWVSLPPAIRCPFARLPPASFEKKTNSQESLTARGLTGAMPQTADGQTDGGPGKQAIDELHKCFDQQKQQCQQLLLSIDPQADEQMVTECAVDTSRLVLTLL